MPLKNRITVALILTTLALIFFAPHAKAGPLSDCQPIIKAGYPIGPDWTDGTQGRHVFFFCTADGLEYTTGFSCRYDDCNPAQLSASFLKVLLATNKTTAIEAEWATHIKWDCTAPPDEPKRLLCEERRSVGPAMLTKALQGYVRPVWRVKPNGTVLTRPSIVLATGNAGPRATVGTLCLPEMPQGLSTDADIRAQWAGGPAGVVTICTKGTP
mgnify:CR=1 FL=1